MLTPPPASGTQEVFVVEPTQKKEVKLYILRDAAGDEGRRQYQVPSPDLLAEGSNNFPTVTTSPPPY